MDRILINPLYAGRIRNSWGMDVEGGFPPIVSRELFDQVQRILSGNGKVFASQGDEFPLRVFVRCCKCGGGITGSFSTGKLKKKYPYYCCPKKGCKPFRSRPRDLFHLQFTDMLEKLAPSPKAVNALKVMVAVLSEQREEQQKQIQAKVRSRIEELETKKQGIFDLVLNGTISKEVYDVQTNKVDR